MKQRNRPLPENIVAIFYLIILFFLPFPVQAAETYAEVASVVAVRGSVLATNETGESRKLSTKSPIFGKDTIKTGDRGRIQILFSDNTIYSLGKKSELKIDQYNWQPEQGKGALRTSIKEGVFRVMGGAITKVSPDNFSTETPYATIGIRGSMYAGTVTGSALAIVFNGGKGIQVSNQFGTVNIDRPGHGTHVTAENAPEKPGQLSVEEVKKLNKALVMEPEETTLSPTSEQPPPPIRYEEEGPGNGPGPRFSVEPTAMEIPPPNETAPVVDPDGPVEPVSPTPPPSDPDGPVEPVSPTPPPSDPDGPVEPEGPSPLPMDGLHTYTGNLSGTAVNVDTSESTITGTVGLEINWHNGKVIGRVHKTPPLFFFGEMSGNAITNITFMGSELDGTDPVTAVYGTGGGSISGPDNELFTLSASGSSYEIQPAQQNLYETRVMTASGVREAIDPSDTISPTGADTWKGYIVGLSENMTAIDNARRVYMNSDIGDFVMNIDKDTGEISGSITATNMAADLSQINALTIGGSGRSAYILEDNLAMVLSCDAGNCIDSEPLGTTRGGLKPYGNYMVSTDLNDPDARISEYANWGYWELAYTDPDSGSQYHAHVPGSRWISGKLTPGVEVENLVSTNFVGAYSGTVFASKIDTAGMPQVSDHKGTFAMNVDFGNIGATGAVTGTISLPGEPVLSVSSGMAGNATTSGFANSNLDAVTNGVDTVSAASFNGAFYGPEARSLAGDFYTRFTNGVSYTGIYGGDR